MLQILGVFSHIEVSITSGLYAVVARVYDILLELIQDTSDLTGASETFQSLLTTCYVLAGVFMLFRTAIGMIQMIINPDQVSDAKVGAGKLMTRIVISIILLLVLVPNGILFDNKKGLFPRIEHALISAEDGLIINLINENVEGPSPYIEGMVFQAKSDIDRGITSNFFVEDVYAADVYKCYYYQISEKAIGSTGKQRASIKKYYRLSFSKSKKNNGKTYTKIKNSDDWYFYSLTSDSEVGKGAIKDKDGDPLRYTKWSKVKVLNKKESTRKGDEKSKYAKDSSFATCPPGILQSGEVLSVSPKFDAKISVNYTKDFTPNGLYGGTTNLKDLVDHANNFMKGRDQDDALVYDTNAEDIETPSKSYLDHIDPTAKVFAQGTASSFQDCAQGSEEKCESVQSKMFLSSNANDKLEDLIDSGDLQLGFIISMIAGIGLIVYLLVLCVDIIVRRFKLMLLQVMAPIPAISYVDPNDKIFPQWLKMYVSTYLDLFIKLIAIALAVGILNGVLEGDTWKNGNLLYRFFYIVAILVFAKLVPSMISKIFGLDSLGGSFKDILGMGKAAAGFGAGAALGLGAGAITTGAALAAGWGKGGLKGAAAAGLGALSSAGAAVVGGAASGAKGNIRAGAQQNFAAGKKQREAIADGSTLKGRTMAKLLNAAGFDNPYEKAVAKRDASQEFVNAAKAYEDESLNKVNKAIGNGYGNMFSGLVNARNQYQEIQNGAKIKRYTVDDNGTTTTFTDKISGKKTTFDINNMSKDDWDTYKAMEEQNIGVAEAGARITGEEKKAAKTMREVFNNGNSKELEKYGYELNDDDYLEMKSLYEDADAAGRSAGYDGGYDMEGRNKTQAKQDVKTYSAAARANKPDHDAIQRGS